MLWGVWALRRKESTSWGLKSWYAHCTMLCGRSSKPGKNRATSRWQIPVPCNLRAWPNWIDDMNLVAFNFVMVHEVTMKAFSGDCQWHVLQYRTAKPNKFSQVFFGPKVRAGIKNRPLDNVMCTRRNPFARANLAQMAIFVLRHVKIWPPLEKNQEKNRNMCNW